MTRKSVSTELQAAARPFLDARTVELLDRAVQIEQEDARAAGTISFVSRIFNLARRLHHVPHCVTATEYGR